MSLYYESHVTLAPVSDELEVLEKICTAYGFRLAKLYMGHLDNLTPSNLDSFTTARSDDYIELRERMTKFIGNLKKCNFTVRRYKIESAIIDSKMKDSLQIFY